MNALNPIVNSNLPLLACLVSLLAVPFIVFSKRRPNLREGWTLLAGVAKFALVLSMWRPVMEGKIIRCTLIENILPGVPLEFRVDGLGMLFAIVASGLWILTSLYSMGYMRGLSEHSQTRFFSFFAISLSATLGVAFAGNLFTLYLFYEALSMATYPLVTHHQDKEARGGGRTYLTYLLGTSVGFLLPAIIYIYIKSGGSMTFNPQGFLAGEIDGVAALPLFLLMIFGFAKGGLMPFHSWLPGAMVAPTPVSALLHAVAVVKVGVFCIARIVLSVFGVEYLAKLDIALVLSWLAAFTVIVSSLIAMTQDNLKRRLAFSTIGQLSYIILGVSLLSHAGIAGGLMHIATHALGKITLFACAGAIFVATGKKYTHQIDGIGRQMPITMGAFTIGALSVTGLPPTAGFISKWYLLFGTLEAGQIPLLVVFLLSTLLNAYYLLKPVYRAFFIPPHQTKSKTHFHEAPILCLIPLVATSTLTVLLFFEPSLLMFLVALMA